MEKPKYLYKYRGIKNKKKPIEDHSIDALFKCYSIFSSRKNLNDLFDTKISFKHPSPKIFKGIINKLPKSERKVMSKHVNKGKYTSDGRLFLENFKNEINKIIDSYAIFSLASKNDCNLMWAHYADSHNGFCIEFNSDHITVDKIVYQNQIAEMDFADFLLFYFKLESEEIIGEKVKNALNIKLDEWEYEDEYRLVASKKLAEVKPGDSFTPVDYPVEYVNSIIFGVRMDSKIKNFIINNIPFKAEFKQAIEGKSKVRIVSFNPKLHI